MKHTVRQVKLKNGARGLIINIPDALVMTYDINFRAGEYLVDPNKWEIPHLMEHVLLGANELIPKARDFHAELEKNGAFSNASTGVYDITYEAECADFEWDRVLNLILIAISKPLFLEEEFQAEFGNVREEMTARSNNHSRRLNLEMRKANGFIAKTDSERLKLMNNVSLEDVKAHHKRTHFTSNMRFVIAGNLTPAKTSKLIDMLEKIDLPRGKVRFALPNEVPKKLNDPIYINNDSVDNIYFYIDTYLKRELKDEEIEALGLLNVYLTETLYSKILGSAREKGLLYHMSSGLSQSKNCFNWWFGAQVMNSNAQALFDIIISEVAKVKRGDISLTDIETTKQYCLGSYQRSAQTVGATAGGYTSRYFFDGKIEDYYNYPAHIKAVTKEGIVEVCNLMLSDKIWSLGVLGNCGDKTAKKLKEQISVLWN